MPKYRLISIVLQQQMSDNPKKGKDNWNSQMKSTIKQLRKVDSDDELEIEVAPMHKPKSKFDIFLSRKMGPQQSINVDKEPPTNSAFSRKQIDLTNNRKNNNISQNIINVEEHATRQNMEKYKQALLGHHQRPLKNNDRYQHSKLTEKSHQSSLKEFIRLPEKLPKRNPEAEMRKQMKIVDQMNKPQWQIQKDQRRQINQEKYPSSFTHSYNIEEQEMPQRRKKQFTSIRGGDDDEAHQQFLRKRAEILKENRERKQRQAEEEMKRKKQEAQRRQKQRIQEQQQYILHMMDDPSPKKKVKQQSEIRLNRSQIIDQINEEDNLIVNKVQQRYGIHDMIVNSQNQTKNFIKGILKYKYNKPDKQENKSIPNNFGTQIAVYKKSFQYLIMAECIADISGRLKKVNNQGTRIPISVTHLRQDTDGNVELWIRNNIKEDQKLLKNYSISRNRIGLISSNWDFNLDFYGLNSRREDFAFIGLMMVPQTKDQLTQDVKIKTIISLSEFQMKLNRKQKNNQALYFFDLEKLTTSLRQYIAVSNIQYYDLGPAILDPHVVEREHTQFVKNRQIIDNILENLKSIFNQMQYQSIRQMVIKQKGFTLLQGPPGTGKTSTLMGLLSAQYEYLKKTGDTRKIMICAPSNAAVDHITKRIISEGLFTGDGEIINPRILRMGVVDTTDCDVRKVTLDDIVQKKVQQQKNLNKNISTSTSAQLKQKIIELSKQIRLLKDPQLVDKKKAQLLKYQSEMYTFRSEKYVINRKTYSAIENHQIHTAEIILTTLTSSGSERMDPLRGEIACLIVDEAAQATEPNLLIAFHTKVQKILLIGDPYQLPATCISTDANVTLFNRSLFERFLDAGLKPFFLNIQYRMDPMIRNFPSYQFYSDRLIDSQSVITRKIPGTLQCFKDRCVLFIDVKYSRQQKRGDSYQNKDEAAVASLILQCFLGEGLSVGCITPYQGQRRAIIKDVRSSLEGKQETDLDFFQKYVMVNTVDSFQGQEKDVIIVSTVRANHNHVGFLKDQRRINVTLTRAKHLVIVVGHGDTLGSNEVWNNFLEWTENHQTYYTVYKPQKVKKVIEDAFDSYCKNKVHRKKHNVLSTDVRKKKRDQIQSKDFAGKGQQVPNWLRLKDETMKQEGREEEKSVQKVQQDGGDKYMLRESQCQQILGNKEEKQKQMLNQEIMFARMQELQKKYKEQGEFKFLFE